MTAGVIRQHFVDRSFDVLVLVAFEGLRLGDLTASKFAARVLNGLFQLAVEAAVVQTRLGPVARLRVAALDAEAEQCKASKDNRLLPHSMHHSKGLGSLLEAAHLLWGHAGAQSRAYR